MRSRAAQDQLWRELAYLFEEDDGSLPEVHLNSVAPEGVVRIFNELRSRAEPIDPTSTFWHDELNRDVPVSEVPDIASLVAEGRVGDFVTMLRGIRSHGVRLPDLGIFVFQDEIVLFYRMGSEWNAQVLAVFVELLADLLHLAPQADLDIEEYALPEVREQFRRAVQMYLRFGDLSPA